MAISDSDEIFFTPRALTRAQRVLVLAAVRWHVATRLNRGSLTGRAWRQRRRSRRFQRRLDRTWAGAFDWFDLTCDHATRVVARHNAVGRYPSEAVADQYETLRDLHARGLRVAQEVRALLAAGHSDGAVACWRRLHEIEVTMAIIAADGPARASAYRLSMWRRYRALHRVHNKLAPANRQLTEPELSPEHVDALKRTFGPGLFKDEYGWAAQGAKERPTFRDLEVRAGLGAARPLYAQASVHTHGDAMALVHTFSQVPRGLLIVGGADTGLEVAGAACIETLARMTGLFAAPYGDRTTTAALFSLAFYANGAIAAFEACADALADSPDPRIGYVGPSPSG